MDYGKVLNRAVNVVWQNKFLIVLGILAALGSGSFGGGGGGGEVTVDGSGAPLEDEFAALAVGVVIFIACVALVVGIVFWVISSIARGGMIASVNNLEEGDESSFSQAWRAGWGKVWTLLGIGFLPAIPGLILFVGGLMAFGAYGGITALFGEDFGSIFGGTTLGILAIVLVCLIGPVVLVLSILRNFAERACMLEDLGVIDSYRRGASVLGANIGEAIILFVLQIVIFIGLGIALFVPGIVVALCCFLWPIYLVAQGAVNAYLSALWTLAWRSWTGEPPMLEQTTTTA
jgi:hypothetical protein